MIVAADTTPLPCLAVLGEIEVLSRLFGEVSCPLEVLAECRHPHAPAALQRWAAEFPPWLIVRDAPVMEVEGVQSLDPGEAAVIRLALHLRADVVLMDERKGERKRGRTCRSFLRDPYFGSAARSRQESTSLAWDRARR